MSGAALPTPSVSVAMVVYQQEAFVEEAVQSILAQACDPVEILICDDCSTDKTYEIVASICGSYDGPHRVRFWQRSEKAGPGNLQLLLRETTGDIVVVAHGDDIASPERVARLTTALVESGAAIVSSNATLINEDGTSMGHSVPDALSGVISARTLLTKWDQHHLGATHAFRRAVFEEFAPWSVDRFFGGADTVFPVRAELLGGCYFVAEPLVAWRQHEGNLSKRFRHFDFPKPQRREFRLTRRLALCQTLLQDVRAFAAQHPDSALASTMSGEIETALFETLQRWIGLRNRLLSRGKHPVWRDLAEVESASFGRRSVGAGDGGSRTGRNG